MKRKNVLFSDLFVPIQKFQVGRVAFSLMASIITFSYLNVFPLKNRFNVVLISFYFVTNKAALTQFWIYIYIYLADFSKR